MPTAPAKKTAAKKAPARRPTKPSGIAMPAQIVPVGEGSGKFCRWLIYGEPGSGKTVFAGTSPNALIAEADRGDESAAIAGSQAKKWNITDWNDMQDCYDYLRHGGYQNHDWFWIDSGTLFQERGLDNIMDDLVALKPHRQVWAPDKGEYGQNMSRMTRLMRDVVQLPMNVGVTAHALRLEDEDGETVYMPYFQGRNMPQRMCTYFGLVAHMEMRLKDGKEVPRLSAKKDLKYYAKDRYGGRVGAMINPTVPKITRRIETGGSATTEASDNN